VKTYPCVQQDYDNPLYTAFTRLTSTFSESMPSVTNFDAEAAYDIWLNNYQIEIMIWVDNHDQTPSGHVIATIKIDNQVFALFQGGPAMFSFVLSGKPETKGTVDILSFLSWLVSHHDLSSSSSVTQVNFGWEIASTDGIPMDFAVNGYSLTTGLRG
jgi:Glycosyl hydrolase family 12